MKSRSARGREFGIVMGAALSVGAFVSARRAHAHTAWGLGACAAILVILAVARPILLQPIADGWALLGRLLGRVTTPILLALVFVAIVVPLGVLQRIFGSDALRRRRDPKAATYWIERKRRAFEPSDFERLS